MLETKHLMAAIDLSMEKNIWKSMAAVNWLDTALFFKVDL